MSRFGTGLGFNIQDIALISGIATEIFNANVANFETNWLDIGNPVGLHSLSSVTLCTWMNSDDLTESASFSKEDPSSGMTLGQGLSGSTKYWGRIITNQGIQDIFSNTDIQVGLNTHVALTYTSGTLKLYINGILETTQLSVGSLIANNTTSLFMGQYGYADILRYNGSVMQGMVYPRALSDAETLAIGTSPKCWGSLIINTPSLSDALISLPAYNHVGFEAQELINQGSIPLTATNINNVLFTGSAQIECEA